MIGVRNYQRAADIYRVDFKDVQKILNARKQLIEIRGGIHRYRRGYTNPSRDRFATIVEKLLENSIDTFGTEEDPVDDVEISVFSNSEYHGRKKVIRRKYEGDLSMRESTKGINDLFLIDILKLARATDEECEDIGFRTMTREEFEDIMIRAFKHEPARSIGRYLVFGTLTSDEERVLHLKDYFLELQQTPYTDRATLGKRVQSVPNETKELTEDEWESYKEQHLNSQ